MSEEHKPAPERPRSEPEIIPPGRADEWQRGARVWYAVHEGGRVFVGRPGPFSIILALLIGGLAIAAVLSLLLGAVLIAIPVAIVAIAAAFLSGWFRRYRGNPHRS